MAVGYRAILRLDDGEDAIRIAEEQLHSWLRSKTPPRRNASLETAEWEGLGDHHLGPKSMLRVVEATEGADDARRRLYRLEEGTDNGTFVVSMFALATPHAREGLRQTIVVEAEKLGADGDSAISGIGTPRLVRNILDRTVVRDGTAVLAGSPTRIHEDDVPGLVGVIGDPDRIASVVVGASLSREIDDRWATLLKNLTVESSGVAAVYSVDADAVEALNASLPASHRVLAGRVRTFAPMVDFSSIDDGLRHRYLGPRFITENIRHSDTLSIGPRARYLHAASTRRRFIELKLPADVRRGLDILIAADFQLDRQVRTRAAIETATLDKAITGLGLERPRGGEASEITEATAPETEVAATRPDAGLAKRLESLLADFVGSGSAPDPVEELRRVLTDTVIKAREARAEAAVAVEQANEMLERVVSVEEANLDLESRLEELELEAAIEAEESDRANRAVAFYRQQLVEAQRFDSLNVPIQDQEWDPPASVGELIDRLVPGSQTHPIAARVQFTGDADDALSVEKRDPFGRYAANLWSYCRVLFDYASARAAGYQGNVHTYLTGDNAPDGQKCSPQRHAATESETTQNQWADTRWFPVPTEVDPAGSVHMYAHFKPTHDSTFAPRMHYFDDTANTGRLYIGYIGRHLKNTKS